MKKLTYLLGLLLVGSLVFTSCSDDDDDLTPTDLTPTISFTLGGEDTTVTLGDTVAFQVVCNANTTSGKKLDRYEVYMIVDNETIPDLFIVEDIDDEAFTEFVGIPTGMSPVAFEGKVYAKITDVEGESSEISFNLTVEAATTPLEAEEPFVWERIGAVPGVGLDMFGLKYNSNVKEVMAVIQKDGAEKLVELDATYWDGIQTQEELMGAIMVGEDLGDEGYRGVSAEASATYNDVLGVLYDGEYYIINITEGTVENVTAGTKVTITGNYKK